MVDRFLNGYARAFQRWMPTPLSIAVMLTGLAALLALREAAAVDVMGAWAQGMWSPGLIRFGFQAMFMLVLGHVLALAPPVTSVLNRCVHWIIRTPHWVACKVALLSMGLGWLNWGIGLVGGAILVRGVMDAYSARGTSRPVHWGVVGAAGYSGMLVWHGGLSGSAPLKAAEAGHLRDLVGQAPWASVLPDSIGLRETVFSSWSLALTCAVALTTTMLFAWLGRTIAPHEAHFPKQADPARPPSNAEASADHAAPSALSFADRLDRGRWLGFLTGAACLAGAGWWATSDAPWQELKFITPDWINMVLLGGALVAHRSMNDFLSALDEAIRGASGILVQFPLYFGIMGMVTGTGLGAWIADGLVGVTSRAWLPVALFSSSGILNIFVPSGGGQWAVQGPLVLEACHALGLDYAKGIMAMAYGDQLTNMLQPFWALPLLGITGLKARDILPYTLLIMVFTGAVMACGMAFW